MGPSAILVALLLGVFLGACASNAREPGREAPGRPEAAGEVDVSDDGMPETTADPEGETEEPRPEGTVERGVARPRVVAPSSSPGGSSKAGGSAGGGRLREAPAPGIPKPLVKLEQDVKQALGQRLTLDVSEIETIATEEVTWPDASLGCPEPGRMYAQVRTAGYRLTLRAGGREYRYHTQGTERFVLCEASGHDDGPGAHGP